jgi:exodeoxyribonuclease VII large subunit
MPNQTANDPEAPRTTVLTVSALVRSARDVLERRFPLAWVRGEISNFTRAASGHCYFTLKDDAAQVDCVMFQARAAALDWAPREGMRVEVRALVTLYEPRGRFQLRIETMREAGLGPLYERFLKLKQALERDGLFDPERKRPLPAHPRRIGVVTSLAAAALRDVLTTLARRNPAVGVVVYPVPVQGDGAAERIAQMLARANQRAECDLLLLVRGGGSIEDLWQFNEAAVAYAIRASAIPVVVGVGHETDVTIADFAADRRAATPTAAAELAVPQRAELVARIAELARRAARETRRRFETAAQSVDALTRRLVHPAERLRSLRTLLAQLGARLSAATARRLDTARYALGTLAPRLVAAAARRREIAAARVAELRARLGVLDPRAVLARGYSITRTAAGEVLRDAARVSEGEQLHTTLARGTLESEVRRKR